MEILDFNFFTKKPYDFELKKYKMLSYIVKVDELYINTEYSPWLLNNRLLLLDCKNFISNLESIRKNLTKRSIQFGENSVYYRFEFPEKIESLDHIEEVVSFSIPHIKRSNDLGSDLASSSNAILW
tara:strand:+ start:106 stop:483 length:378 start_codon:yes stop_codon:yes gene_type:complete